MIRRMMIESHIKVILIQDQAEVVEIIPEDIKEQLIVELYSK